MYADNSSKGWTTVRLLLLMIVFALLPFILLVSVGLRYSFVGYSREMLLIHLVIVDGEQRPLPAADIICRRVPTSREHSLIPLELKTAVDGRVVLSAVVGSETKWSLLGRSQTYEPNPIEVFLRDISTGTLTQLETSTPVIDGNRMRIVAVKK